MAEAEPKRQVRYFVSYSHLDEALGGDFLTRLKSLLAMSAAYEFVGWRDDQIDLGSEWRQQIAAALEACDLGLLLLSPNFFSSDYIRRHELPRLLIEAAAGTPGAKLLAPVVLVPFPLGDEVDLRGLEARQLFRDDKKRAFEQCWGGDQKAATPTCCWPAPGAARRDWRRWRRCSVTNRPRRRPRTGGSRRPPTRDRPPTPKPWRRLPIRCGDRWTSRRSGGSNVGAF